MLWNRTDEKIIEQWKVDSAYSVEAGEMPIFDLGISNTSLDGIFGLAALQNMIEKRADIIQPLVTIGGHSALWLFAMLQTSRHNLNASVTENNTYRNRSYSQIKEPIVVFSGTDPATHIALLSTQRPIEESTATVSQKKRWTGLGIGLSDLFAPESEPIAITQVENLPFATEPVRMQQHLTQYAKNRVMAPQSAPPSPTQTISEREQVHEQTQWIARATIGLAILMLLAAFVA